MSAIASDSILAEREAPRGHSAREDKKHSRAEEFRSALGSYIAEYADYQKGRSDIIGQRPVWQFFPPDVAFLTDLPRRDST